MSHSIKFRQIFEHAPLMLCA